MEEPKTPPNAHHHGHLREMVFGKNPRRTLFRVCVWSVAANIFFHSLLVPITVTGSSMMPTYHSGTRNLVNRLAYLRHPPARGDVVVLKVDPVQGLFIKRVVGLPGERVQIGGGHVQINGRPLIDGFTLEQIPWSTDEIVLGPDQYFVIGDNRCSSFFGLTHSTQILGKVVF